MTYCRSPCPLQHGFPLSRELWLARHWAVNSRWALSQAELKTAIPFHSHGMGLVPTAPKYSCTNLWQTQLEGYTSILTGQESASVLQSINLSPFQPCNTIRPLLLLHTLYKWFPVWLLFSKAFAEVGKHLPFITRKLVLYCSSLWSLNGHDPFEILSTDFFFHGEENTQPLSSLRAE